MFFSKLEARLTALEVRMGSVEKEAEITRRLRGARSDRRDWYLSKFIPALGTIIIAVLTLNTVFKFF